MCLIQQQLKPAFLLVFWLTVSYLITGGQTPGKETQTKAQQDQTREQKDIKSVVVHVVGQSFVGVRYSKRITVTKVDSDYVLDYYCFKCPCPKIAGKKLELRVAEEFLSLIESLQDGGQMASCCDHPYTQVEIAYRDGSVKKVTLGFDVGGKARENETSGLEKVLNLECDATKSRPG